MAIAAAGMVVGPYFLARIDLITQLKPHAWVVLIVAYFGILLKSSISYLITRDFRYDKSAYDLCVLVFGGVLACTALQISFHEVGESYCSHLLEKRWGGYFV